MAARSVQRTGCHKGPTIHFDRPRAGTLAPSFPGWAGRSVIENAAGGWLSVCEAAVDGRWDGVSAVGAGDRPARDPPSPPPSNFPVVYMRFRVLWCF
jgi:hypothetical protein